MLHNLLSTTKRGDIVVLVGDMNTRACRLPSNDAHLRGLFAFDRCWPCVRTLGCSLQVRTSDAPIADTSPDACSLRVSDGRRWITSQLAINDENAYKIVVLKHPLDRTVVYVGLPMCFCGRWNRTMLWPSNCSKLSGLGSPTILSKRADQKPKIVPT